MRQPLFGICFRLADQSVEVAEPHVAKSLFIRFLPHSRMSARARVCVCLVAIECESGFFLRFYGFEFSLIKPAESAICSRMFYCFFEHHVQHDE